MKKVFCGAAALAIGLLGASTAHAAAFYIDFCPGATCPAGVTEASLLFTEVLNPDGDDNDYLLTIKITGDGTSPTNIDTVQFAITGVETPDGYEAKPTLASAPAVGSPWSVFWDITDGSPSDCTSDTENGQGVCAQSTGFGATTNGTNIWTFNVDLDDDEDPLALGSNVNLRVNFVNCAVKGGNGPDAGEIVCHNNGNLSPGGGNLNDTTGPSDTSGPSDSSGTPTGPVPEPALLSLLGFGLVGAAARLRKKS